MTKEQQALNTLREKGYTNHFQPITLEYQYPNEFKILQELVDKSTPKKLKSKTDKDGRLLWICPTCGDVYMKFWSDVETISCRKYCDECGQALDWSDEDEEI